MPTHESTLDLAINPAHPVRRRLRLIATSGKVHLRILELQASRWVFLTRPCEIVSPPISPTEYVADDWLIDAGQIRLQRKGCWVEVQVDGARVGLLERSGCMVAVQRGLKEAGLPWG